MTYKNILYKIVFGFIFLVIGLMIVQAFLVYIANINRDIADDETFGKDQAAYLETRIKALENKMEFEKHQLEDRILIYNTQVDEDFRLGINRDQLYKEEIRNMKDNILSLEKEMLDLRKKLSEIRGDVN